MSHDSTRVVRIITRLNIGGPAIQAIELSTRLAERGYRTVLAHGRLGAGEGDMRYLLEGRASDAAEVVEIPHLRRRIAPADDVRAAAQIYGVLRRFRPAIVHTHMAKAGSVGRLAALAYNRTVPRARRARLVHTYHGHVLDGYFGPATTRAFVGIERLLARASDRIVAISPHIRDELLEGFRVGRADQYRIVPLGFDLTTLAAIDHGARQAARAALGISPAAHVVTTVGRLTAIKQHALFIEAAALVADRDPAAAFLIAGDGEMRPELEALVRRRGLESRLRFLGWRRDLATVYGATDVFLLTSRNEGTPVALIESLAAGVPGVSTDVGGVRDVIGTEAVGLLAPVGDARALADHVTALLGNHDRRRRMGDAGRESVVARYGLDRLVVDIDALYRELLH
jgi:glycosyltransferase involved in cell wall biosynthesis